MKKLFFLFTALTFCFVFSNCSNDDGNGSDDPQVAKTRVDIPLSESGKRVNSSIQQFSLKLIGTTVGRYDNHERIYDDNYVISPLGISYIMGMLENGADEETYDMIANGLGLADFSLDEINDYFSTMTHSLSDVDNTSTFICANSLWISDGRNFAKDYAARVEDAYNAELKCNVGYGDGNSKALLSQWIAKVTNGLITHFGASEKYDQLDEILNVICYKGIWRSPFDERSTREDLFTTENGTTTKVMMMNKKTYMAASLTDEIQMVTLPYGNGAFEMTFFMPTDKTVLVDSLIAHISDKWQSWRYYSSPINVYLSLPKFEISCSSYYSYLLEKIGLRVFPKGEVPGITPPVLWNPHYPKILEKKDGEDYLSFERPLQSIYLKLDEKGTKAVSATATTNNGGDTYIADVEKEIRINFNRPFAFVLSETSTGAILFAGRISDPSKL